MNAGRERQVRPQHPLWYWGEEYYDSVAGTHGGSVDERDVESGKPENYPNLTARRCCNEQSCRGHTAFFEISGASHVRGVGYGMFPQNLAR